MQRHHTERSPHSLQESTTIVRPNIPQANITGSEETAKVTIDEVMYLLPTSNGRSKELEKYGYHIIKGIKKTDGSLIFLGENSSGNQVCIKAISLKEKNAFSSKKLKAIATEAEYASYPSLANDIVATQDFIIDKEAGFAFIVMDYFDPKERPTLEALLSFATKNGIDLPVSMIFDICQLLTEILEKVDQANLLHRDIKHGNVYVEFDEQLKPKKVWLGDFGLAQTKDEASKKTNIIQGTLVFLSPERIEGENNPNPIDHRSDIYSLTVMIHYLLTKRLYFLTKEDMINYAASQGQTGQVKLILQAMREFHKGNTSLFTQEESQSLASQGIDIKKLERALGMGLAKNPEDRYQNYKALSIALQRSIIDPYFAEQLRQVIIQNNEDQANDLLDELFQTSVIHDDFFDTTTVDMDEENLAVTV